MADFCKHHSIEMFGEDFRELAHPDDPDPVNEWFWVELCESCGAVQVNKNGERVSPLDDEEVSKDNYISQGLFFNPLPQRSNHGPS